MEIVAALLIQVPAGGFACANPLSVDLFCSFSVFLFLAPSSFTQQRGPTGPRQLFSTKLGYLGTLSRTDLDSMVILSKGGAIRAYLPRLEA
jgi:hypothetical protein